MDPAAEWSTSDYLLARVSDALELNTYLYLKVHSEDGSNLTAPEPIPRPGEEKPTEEFEYASGEEVAHFLTHML
ncbi:protein of unknown function [Streptantibioticus cattleyicolor NRRL 8057 = DSM 46488]|nr:hypothetical protein [Streptomyces sp. SID5468]CCB74398.1 protein of unknown function [Streptantibioticus cattleyicolor NRRL 8057 = DSM 46488]